VDLEGEVERASQQLSGIGVAIAGKEQPLSLAHLMDRLREPVDILYLACHGALTEDGPYLFLQARDGTVARVKGRDFADRLGELPRQPRLVVLASCELHSLAPMLAGAGVPAIVAMLGKISMETVKHAMPVFFRELLRDGQIDRAMAAARSVAVARNRPDFWMPALYLRLRGGRIWQGAAPPEDFDVFLCYNSADKSEVRKICDALKSLGLNPWLDEEQLRPGLPWQEILETQLGRIRTAAVFVGVSGLGPWQSREMRGFIDEFVRRECPVIPVLLPTAAPEPNLPLLLRQMTWVDFRGDFDSSLK